LGSLFLSHHPHHTPWRMADKQLQKKKYVQTFGRKKTSIAVALAKEGTGKIRVNGVPLEIVEPEILRYKVFEPILLLGNQRFSRLDIKVRVKGGGSVAKFYAIRQAISRAIVAFHAKYVDEASKRELKELLVTYDKTLLVSDPRRSEPKKYGGPGARAKYQKSYR